MFHLHGREKENAQAILFKIPNIRDFLGHASVTPLGT